MGCDKKEKKEAQLMETLKAEAISAISKLPESASIDEIMYELSAMSG